MRKFIWLNGMFCESRHYKIIKTEVFSDVNVVVFQKKGDFFRRIIPKFYGGV